MNDTLSRFEKKKKLSIYWYNKASDLNISAKILWEGMDKSNSFINPVYKMICGMSLELLFKAIIIQKEKVLNDKTHNLITLSKEAEVQFSDKEKGLLEILSEAIIWYGRYPVPKKEEHFNKLNKLYDRHMFDKEKMGNMTISKPNGSLNWDSYCNLWIEANTIYWNEKENF